MYVLRYVNYGVINMFNFILLNILLVNHTLDPLRSNILQELPPSQPTTRFNPKYSGMVQPTIQQFWCHKEFVPTG
jgi:hypothetical protein